ncbi:MAG: endonuclease/exonuclease/phosphatase family protein [Acidobacteriota bacterium]
MRLCCLFAVACTSTAPVAITSIASVPRPMPVPARLQSALRVMSYNVNFGIAGDPEAARAIASAAPDVVFLQETNDVWAAALIRALPAYPHHHFTPPRGWPAGGMGVLSRYPIVSIDELPSVNGPFFAWRVVLDAPGGRVQVLGVHLRPAISDGGSWVVGFFSTRDNRAREIAWHVARLDPQLPTLVVGDFNEEGDGRAVAVLDRLGYTDAIAQHAGHHRTWEWPVSRLTLRFQLDHVMYDAHFTAPAAGVVEAGRSDHKPVWADVERVPP